MAVKLRISTAACTDVGLVRTNNEDNYFFDKEHYVFAVADGMGGHAAGEVASKIAVDVLREATMRRGSVHPSKLLEAVFKNANKKILDEAQKDPSKKGMGTTLSVLIFEDGKYYFGHIGDSRIYLYRNGSLRLITCDHTLANKIKGKLSPDEYERYSHILTRSLGQNKSVIPQIVGITRNLPPGILKKGDVFLLCTDGLYDMVDHKKIQKLVSSYQHDLDELCRKLIQEANKNGGKDNVTVVLVRIDDINDEVKYPEDVLELENHMPLKATAGKIEKEKGDNVQVETMNLEVRLDKVINQKSKFNFRKIWALLVALILALGLLIIFLTGVVPGTEQRNREKRPGVSKTQTSEGNKKQEGTRSLSVPSKVSNKRSSRFGFQNISGRSPNKPDSNKRVNERVNEVLRSWDKNDLPQSK